jgi:uncharacterized protein YndB with AHSA1/START domain
MGWSFATSATADVPPERVWAILTDVPSWAAWNPGIAAVELDGPVVAGARGTSRRPGGPRSSLEITDVVDGRALGTRVRLPLLDLRFAWELEPSAAGGVEIRHRATMSGAGERVFRRTIGPRLEHSMAASLDGLIAAAAG